MVLTSLILLGIALAYAAFALLQKLRLRISVHQALLYAPLKLAYRIQDEPMRDAQKAAAPVIYVVSHQSRLDPALMLSLLPENTLHILDLWSAKSPWLEPWRELARTIAFNAEHVFVSRRLVRVLKGKGRLAVYIPENIEPDTKSLRLYRAVARIAMQADARIVPVFVGGARHLPFSLVPAEKAPAVPTPRNLDLAAHDRRRTDGPVWRPVGACLQRAVRQAGGGAFRCHRSRPDPIPGDPRRSRPLRT
jgi:acyl-[acyl-carrier-protein]-phospholipid O-acyltransferase/long-chain-fatty-acid--[acyl-carrier-protein] ligase